MICNRPQRDQPDHRESPFPAAPPLTEALVDPGQLKCLALLVLVIGLMWRVVRWGLAMPLWGDEAMLGLNVLQRSFSELVQPLDYAQISPVLFLWVQRAVIQLLGPGDWAVRLLPTAAGIGALLLYWRATGRWLPPLEAALATSLLAVSYYPVRHGSEFKPYSFDLLASVVILHGVLGRLDRSGSSLSAWWLVPLLPILLAMSNPAVFVAGGLAVVLTVRTFRHRQAARYAELAVYGLVLMGAFALSYLLVTRGQDQATAPAMREFWKAAFPPSNPLQLPIWLLDIHTGNMLAYPIGGKFGGSTATFILCLVGVMALWRSQRTLLAVLVLPFGLTLAAATLHRYPYGTSARVSQHLAPAVCLLAAFGSVTLLRRWVRIPTRRQTVIHIIFFLLAGVGLVGVGRDIIHPYKTLEEFQVRESVDRAIARQPDQRVVVLGDREELPANYLWYLLARGATLSFVNSIDDPAVRPSKASLSMLAFRPLADLPARVKAKLEHNGYVAVLREDREYLLGAPDGPQGYCRSLWWVSTPATDRPQ